MDCVQFAARPLSDPESRQVSDLVEHLDEARDVRELLRLVRSTRTNTRDGNGD